MPWRGASCGQSTRKCVAMAIGDQSCHPMADAVFRILYQIRNWPIPSRLFWHIKDIEGYKVLFALRSGNVPRLSIMQILGIHCLPSVVYPELPLSDIDWSPSLSLSHPIADLSSEVSSPE